MYTTHGIKCNFLHEYTFYITFVYTYVLGMLVNLFLRYITKVNVA